MRGVTRGKKSTWYYMDISTHTPHARRDYQSIEHLCTTFQFQLTRLMRGVTFSVIMI